MRREIMLGEDRTTLVAVDPPSSIVGRLTALLNYLARTAPYHGVPVVGPVTPLDATGAPLFTSVWAYMVLP